PHRNAGVRRFTDHGHHALMRTAAFRAVGGYDESFSHNEDAELDHRLIGNGARILLAGDIVVDYYPRATLRGLWRQYYMFGRGRAKTVAKHRIPLKPRQLAPALITPSAL
ncbi:MAG TPA: succinoglycan biosynthesis protein exoa, partial [Terricaulis sp.]|nr:succinoglycan biosynthesis protein exoa [Terricaulis sp.]